jgi:hypothetical protein
LYLVDSLKHCSFNGNFNIILLRNFTPSQNYLFVSSFQYNKLCIFPNFPVSDIFLNGFTIVTNFGEEYKLRFLKLDSFLYFLQFFS